MIFYISCTGNTLWTAEELGRNIGEELVDMADDAFSDKTWRLRRGERIGFCFPVHGWRPPKVVRDFIRRLRVDAPDEAFCYAVCTAGDTVGEAVNILRRDLSSIGLTLHSAYSLLMPNTYVGLPFMDVDPIGVQERKLRQAKADMRRCVGDITARRAGTFSIARGRWPRVNSRFLGALFLRFMVTDKPFHVDREMCVGCGECAKACPTGDIQSSANGRPAWLHSGRCLSCFACYHHCPLKAIRYGGRTRNKGQYFFRNRI